MSRLDKSRSRRNCALQVDGLRGASGWTSIDLFCFIGIPACLSFTYLFPRPDAFLIAFIIGICAACLSLFTALLFEDVYKQATKREPKDWNVFVPAAVFYSTLFSLTTNAGVGGLKDLDASASILGIPSRVLSLLGILASAAFLTAVFARDRLQKTAGCLFLGVLAIAVALHFPAQSQSNRNSVAKAPKTVPEEPNRIR